MALEEWAMTEEPARGHLFVGAITSDMLDRAADAIGDTRRARVAAALPPVGHAAEFAYARAALTAALRQVQPSEEES